MRQTAVEWIVDQMFKQGYFDGNKPLSITNLDHLQHQAKEMEKQQIIDAFNSSYDVNLGQFVNGDYTIGESYYNETYGSKGSDEHIEHNLDEITTSSTELSDEEIFKELDNLPFTKHLDDGQYNDGVIVGFELGAFWYRQQLRNKR